MRLFAPLVRALRPATPPVAQPSTFVPARADFTLRIQGQASSPHPLWDHHQAMAPLFAHGRLDAFIYLCTPGGTQMGVDALGVLLPAHACADARVWRDYSWKDLPGDVTPATRGATDLVRAILLNAPSYHPSQHLFALLFAQGLLVVDAESFFVSSEGEFAPKLHHADPRLLGGPVPGRPSLLLPAASAHAQMEAAAKAPDTLARIFPRLTLTHPAGDHTIPLAFALTMDAP